MQILGTFPSRDVADSIKEAFLAEGFPAHDLVVMSNRETPEPPEDAKLEVGRQNEGGFAGFEEKIGEAVLTAIGKPSHLEGDGTEGEGKTGALLAITVADEAGAVRARTLLERHNASDIEIAQPD